MKMKAVCSVCGCFHDEPVTIENICVLKSRLYTAESCLRDYDNTAIKFIRKVETNRAKSRETYADLQKNLAASIAYAAEWEQTERKEP